MRSLEPSAVFDIETENWDRFLCGSVVMADGTTYSYGPNRESAMVKKILSLEGNVYAHNGGRFDALWLLDAYLQGPRREGTKIRIAESGSALSAVTFKRAGKEDLIIRDSYRMIPMSLAKIGGKTGTGVDCEFRLKSCQDQAERQKREERPVTGCGGYCAFRRDMPAPLLRRVMEYCESDCKALLAGINRVAAFAASERIVLAATVGATAWRTALADDLAAPVAYSRGTWAEIRKGYHGGRTSLFRSKSESGRSYDITSSYPYQCSQPLPVGAPLVIRNPAEAARAWERCAEGIYVARVSVPELYAPPLPRTSVIRGVRRKAYPVGTFVGGWARPELERAVEVGSSVRPLSAVVFPEMTDSLSGLMHRLIGSRLRVGKDSLEGAMLKLWANSLYGKFAQSPRDEEIVIGADPAELPPGARPANPECTAWIIPTESQRLPPSAHAEWAAYITARARVQLHHKLTDAVRPVYCDTDSVFSEERLPSDVEPRLGGWSDEGPYSDFEAMAPKVYRYFRAGKHVGKAKGIGISAGSAEAWSALTRGEPVAMAGVLPFRSALRGGGRLFRARVAERTVRTYSFGDRFPVGEHDSRPPRATELED